MRSPIRCGTGWRWGATTGASPTTGPCEPPSCGATTCSRKPGRSCSHRLAVFAGRFSRTAALTVGAVRDDLPPSQALASLVEASMLIADVSGRATTYQMLPTMRDFGLSNLRDPRRAQSVRRVHAEYVAADAEEMGLRILQAGPTKRIEQSVSVQDFRVAADWALQAGLTDLALDLLVPLCHHLINGGSLTEAAYWHARVTGLNVEESLARWQLELAVAICYFFTGRNEQAEAAFQSLSDSALRIEEPAAWAISMEFLGRARWRLGDLRGGRSAMAEGAAAASDQLADTLWLIEGLAVLELLPGQHRRRPTTGRGTRRVRHPRRRPPSTRQLAECRGLAEVLRGKATRGNPSLPGVPRHRPHRGRLGSRSECSARSGLDTAGPEPCG